MHITPFGENTKARILPGLCELWDECYIVSRFPLGGVKERERVLLLSFGRGEVGFWESRDGMWG